MSGKISEYISAPKLIGTELVDFSVVDAESPTGYVSRKKTLNDVANFNPTFYKGSGTLAGNTAVDQDGNTLYFSGGDWGVDFGSKGIMYNNTNKRVGFGVGSPLAKAHVKGNAAEDAFIVETTGGDDALNIDVNGVSEFINTVKSPEFELLGAETVNSNGIITPPVLTLSQDDYSPSLGWLDGDGNIKTRILRVFTDGSNFFINGLIPGTKSNILTICNVGVTGDITLPNEIATSAAANRFAGSTVLTPNESATFFYDLTSTRWRKM